MRIVGAIAFALLPSAVSAEQSPVVGNVEIVRLCLSSADMMTAWKTAIKTSQLVSDRQGLRDEADEKFREDSRLLVLVAGPETREVMGQKPDGFYAQMDALRMCIDDPDCISPERVADLAASASRTATSLLEACKRDFEGKTN